MKMKESDSLKEYSTRFTEVINQMKSYGTEIADKKVMEKLLITLLKKFSPIVIVTEEMKDILKLSI